MLIQTQSAKLGIATGKNLPELCRETFSRRSSIGLWLQAEVVAMACDVAEVVGAALGLNLLFGIPLFPAALIAGAGAFAILALQQRGFRRLEAGDRGARRRRPASAFGFEIFCAEARRRRRRRRTCSCPGFERHREHPADHRDHRRDGDAARRLPALGADPAAGRRAKRRRAPPDPAVREDRRRDRDDDRRGGQPGDDGHGGVAVQRRRPDRDRHASRAPSRACKTAVSDNAATIFGIALLASGFASSSVGTMSGQVVMQGFIQRRIPMFLRRALTLAPALIVIAIGVDPTNALVISQVVLSFGIPFALIPLVLLARKRDGDGRDGQPALADRDRRACSPALIIALNVFLLEQVFFG